MARVSEFNPLEVDNLNPRIILHLTLRPNFVAFLKKMFEINGREFRIIDRYEEGEKLNLNVSQTDDTVKQLSDIGMIKLVDGRKIVLSQEALAIIDRSETSN